MPIGAGLSKLPKKKNRRVRAYREGGSVAPILLAFFTASVIYYGFTRRPWENNFEEFRTYVLGETPPLRMMGDWEVTKLLALDPKTRCFLAPTNMTEGRISFTEKGRLTADLRTGDEPWTVSAHYVQQGNAMTWTGFESDPASEMPPQIRCSLTDLGEGTVVATIQGNSAMFLKRLEGGDKLKKTLTYRLLNGLLKGKKDDE
ncbi:hypothetical protein BH11ARM2_BH11ARM2_08490 [soil metagenome]